MDTIPRVITSIVTTFIIECTHGDGEIEVRVENARIISVKHLEPRI